MLYLSFFKVLQSYFCCLAPMKPSFISSVYGTARVIQRGIKQGRLASATLRSYKQSLLITTWDILLYRRLWHQILSWMPAWSFDPEPRTAYCKRAEPFGWCSSRVFLCSVMLTPSQLSPHRFILFKRGFLLLLDEWYQKHSHQNLCFVLIQVV